jgi:hypothetical protein
VEAEDCYRVHYVPILRQINAAHATQQSAQPLTCVAEMHTQFVGGGGDITGTSPAVVYYVLNAASKRTEGQLHQESLERAGSHGAVLQMFCSYF